LLHRIKYSTTGNIACLTKAMGCMERYFFLLAFCAYVNEWQTPVASIVTSENCLSGEATNIANNASSASLAPQSFREWLGGRTEIWRMLETLRHRGPR
jgi:hypothetical protein